MKRTSIHRRQQTMLRGSTTLTTVFLLLCAFFVGISFFQLASTASRLAHRSGQRTQSTALAEAALQNLWAQMAGSTGNNINTSPIVNKELKGKVGNIQFSDGVYSGKVIDSSNSVVNGLVSVSFQIEGTGTAPNGIVSKIRSTFTMTRYGITGLDLGDSAIMSNGDVTFNGNSYTKDTSGNWGANVFANGKITNGGSVPIDGIASAYVPTNPPPNAHQVLPLTNPLVFPDAGTVDAWRTTFIEQSRQATASFPSGHIFLSDVKYTASKTLTGPAYIDGDFTVSGGSTLTINPDPSATKPIVVFVNGKVSISGGSSLVNNGVIIVSEGIQTYSGTSSVYSAADMVDCGLFSFSNDLKKAIRITGGSGAAKVGVVYAVNGGVTLSGGSVFSGSVVARGAKSTVTLSGGSSVKYEKGWNDDFSLGAKGWTASRLRNWVRIK